MNKALLETSPEVEQKRKEWLELVELHEVYNKHEVYDAQDHANSALCICKTCGHPLMKKWSWNTGGPNHEYKLLKLATANDEQTNWTAGRLDMRTVRMIPKAYRHFVYEALLSRLGDDKTSGDEEEAIMFCRDKSVPAGNLRTYAIHTGGTFAYAFAKAYGDWSEDLRVAVQLDAKSCYKFAKESRSPARDDERIAISKSAGLALLYAEEVDKGPHQVTRDGAARNAITAMKYAAEIDKSPNTATSRGTLLRTIVLRQSNGIQEWTSHFKGSIKPDDKTRKAACRTKYGAWSYAKHVDMGPHPDTEKVLIHSSQYGFRYMYEVVGAPVKDIECSFSGGYDALQYMGVFSIPPSSMLERHCRRNATTRKVYETLDSMTMHPITKASALKKSLTSCAYIIQHAAFNDHELTRRAKANRTYMWMLEGMVRMRKAVAKTNADRQKAAAKAVPSLPVCNAALPVAKAAAVRKHTLRLVTANGVRNIPMP